MIQAVKFLICFPFVSFSLLAIAYYIIPNLIKAYLNAQPTKFLWFTTTCLIFVFLIWFFYDQFSLYDLVQPIKED